MALVDIIEDVYKCPHYDGYIIVRTQFNRNGGSSYTIKYYEQIPYWLKDEEIQEIEAISPPQCES